MSALETMREIARLVAQLPHRLSEVTLGVSDSACDAICAVSGATVDIHLYRRPEKDFAIESCRAMIDDVVFRAQRGDREVTDEEREKLDQENRQQEVSVTA
jgi:hypothetical protein